MIKYHTSSAARKQFGAAAIWMMGLALTAFQLVGTGTAVAQQEDQAPAIRFTTANDGTEFVVNGTSTLHDWDVKTSTVQGNIFVPGQWVSAKDGLMLIPTFKSGNIDLSIYFEIPVDTIKSESSGMDKKAYEALKKDDFPTITYELDKGQIAQAPKDDHSEFVVQTTGNLTIAGATHPMPLDLTLTPTSTGYVISTKVSFKMTDFNVSPPKALFGTIKSGDDITVTAKWAIKRATPQPKAAEFKASTAVKQAISDLYNVYEKVGQALATGDSTAASSAMAKLDEQIKAFSAVDISALDAQAKTIWTVQKDILNSGSMQALKTNNINDIRMGYSTISAALGKLVNSFGHYEDHPVLQFSIANPNGRKGSTLTWLQTDVTPKSPYTQMSKTDKGQQPDLVFIVTPDTHEAQADASNTNQSATTGDPGK